MAPLAAGREQGMEIRIECDADARSGGGPEQLALELVVAPVDRQAGWPQAGGAVQLLDPVLERPG
jgi:hypothetical protein